MTTCEDQKDMPIDLAAVMRNVDFSKRAWPLHNFTTEQLRAMEVAPYLTPAQRRRAIAARAGKTPSAPPAPPRSADRHRG